MGGEFPLPYFMVINKPHPSVCTCTISLCETVAATLGVYMITSKCDPLWKNRPLAIFHENRVWDMNRRRIYCRVQRSKSQALKRLLSRVMPKKLYTGHPCLSLQFFEKRSVLYVHCSTFNVSVYAPYYTTRLFAIMNLPGKMAIERAMVHPSWS